MERVALDHPPRIERRLLRDQTDRVMDLAAAQFDRATRSTALFTLFFLTLLVIEFGLFAFFFTWLLQASVLAFSLAAILLTLFAYFTLRLYLQTRKSILIQSIRDRYIESCQELLDSRVGNPEYHVSLADICARFSSALQGREFSYYQMPIWLDSLQPYREKISFLWHWEDVLRMRELLLQAAIEEHLKLVRREPTSLEIHTALANSYVTLSNLYTEACRAVEEHDWMPKTESLEEYKRRFRIASERAIEEFKILNDYAPNDPWIHTQLAYSYHDLQMPEKEIREYEIILKLRPNDRDTLFRLGRLSFQEGHNAKGLRVYETLQKQGDKRADELITLYGDYQTSS